MSDRELLELAAKAAGIEHGADRFDSGISLTLPDGRHKSMPKWNPLTDDGDALRLAVKLEIDLCFGAHYVIADGEQVPTVNNANDKNAAVRQAIVLAAAALAKA